MGGILLAGIMRVIPVVGMTGYSGSPGTDRQPKGVAVVKPAYRRIARDSGAGCRNDASTGGDACISRASGAARHVPGYETGHCELPAVPSRGSPAGPRCPPRSSFGLVAPMIRLSGTVPSMGLQPSSRPDRILPAIQAVQAIPTSYAWYLTAAPPTGGSKPNSPFILMDL